MPKSNDEQKLVRTLIDKIGPVKMDEVIGADRVDRTGKYLIKLGGKRVTDAEAESIKHEAEIIENTRLYRLLTETLRYQAQRRMFEESKESEDVFISGKFLLHAISTLEHVIWSAKNPQLIASEKVINTPTAKRVDNRGRIKNNNN